MWNISAAASEVLQAAAAVCRLAANMGVCIFSYSPLGHGSVCTPDLVFFAKEERGVFMSLSILTMDKGVKNLPVFVYVGNMCVHLFSYLFIYFTLTAVVS